MAKQCLIVEDSHVNQKIMGAMVEQLGFSVVLAENGQVALDLLEKQDFDIVLMDIQMPVMDGEEATRQIRRSDSKARNPQIPILAVTGASTDKDKEKFLAIGMNEFLIKPVSKEQLGLLLQKYCN